MPSLGSLGYRFTFLINLDHDIVSHPMNPFPASTKGADVYVRISREVSGLGLVHAPSRPQVALVNELKALGVEELFGGQVVDRERAMAARAGLFLAIDAWDEAHAVAQDLDIPEGSYWHGVVHRREPDASNAKYWFRRLGHHPVFDQLGSPQTHQALPSVAAFDDIVTAGYWDPFRFVDWCTRCEEGKRPELRSELQELQQREMLLLLTYCVRQALGKPGQAIHNQ